MSHVLYLPVPYRAPLGIEIDTDLDNGQATEGKLGGIVVEVYLPHGCLCRLVELQLEEVKGLACAHDHVHTPRGSADFHVSEVSCDEVEDDVEHLLVVALSVGVIAVRDGEQELLQESKCPVYVSLGEELGHPPRRVVHHEGVGGDV